MKFNISDYNLLGKCIAIPIYTIIFIIFFTIIGIFIVSDFILKIVANIFYTLCYIKE
jgi:hypothetical protein